MLQADLAAPSAAPDLADAASGAELRLAMLKRLASLGMRVAEELAERTVNSPYHPEPRHEPGRAFAAISRAVRLTIVLEARVEADLFAMRRGEVPKAAAAPAPRPRRAARVPDNDDEEIDDDGGVEAVARERTWECLVDREDDETLLDRPFDEAVATIRADLGLLSRPEEVRTEDRAERSVSSSPLWDDRPAHTHAPVLAARGASALPIERRAEDDP